MELLSPAGNINNAYAALKAGADAIYLGGKSFSARASASNFSNEEIKEIISYAHSIKRKVYVTLNTLIFQDEFLDAVSFAEFLYRNNVDGIIIQDLGLAYYLHQVYPDMPLNASTQLNCHNIQQAKALIEVGFKRIVLARECSIDFVKEVKNLGVEVEVFCHGSLCVSYSGNCLLSSFIGNRSGNRGRCAQPCRMKYDLLENGNVIDSSEYLISTKDLNTLDFIDSFLSVGVDSLKIEGRLKSLEYVYSVTKAYRNAIDSFKLNGNNVTKDTDIENIKKAFNRDFTKGFIFNETKFSLLNSKSSSHQGEIIGKVISFKKNRLSIRLSKPLHRLDGIRFNNEEQFGLTVEKMFLKKEDVEEANERSVIELIGIDNPSRFLNAEVIKTKDYLLNKSIENVLNNNLKIELKGKFTARLGKPMAFSIIDENTVVEVTASCPENPKGNGTTKERIIEQLNKTGIYPYKFSQLEFDLDLCFIPISTINRMRNEALERYVDLFKIEKKIQKRLYIPNVPKFENFKNYYTFSDDIDVNSIVGDGSFINFTSLDNLYRNETRVSNRTMFNKPYENMHFLINNETENYLIASQYCNITNSYALDCYYNFGFKECFLSTELDNDSILSLVKDYKKRNNMNPKIGIILYGKIDMMIMKSCPIGYHYNNKAAHCQRCKTNKYEILDRIGEKYLLKSDSNCNIKILNNKPIYLVDKIDELEAIGVTSFGCLFNDESKDTIKKLLKEIMDNKGLFNSLYTRGHYNNRPL